MYVIYDCLNLWFEHRLGRMEPGRDGMVSQGQRRVKVAVGPMGEAMLAKAQKEDESKLKRRMKRGEQRWRGVA